ncbi:hypothetical protein AVEN_123079-1 [Araneus ventricosus]|uniref:Helitron helicase-like domain-containing protein n=1 Tax=Araneus ventricosus TaxID=182803 RepID=A0A4Y2RPS9_ARAVE|nr:hypothetical protein AVEN_123079-1 [Araneus ventricosus]
MVYPLLFLNGECGWNSNLEHVEERRSAKRVRVIQLQYYSYRFAVRNADMIKRSEQGLGSKHGRIAILQGIGDLSRAGAEPPSNN